MDIRFITKLKKSITTVTLHPFLIVIIPCYKYHDTMYKKIVFQWLFLTVKYEEQ